MIVLVQNCKKYNIRQEWVRSTWGWEFKKRNIPIFFVQGGYDIDSLKEDNIQLNCLDDYENFITKVQKSYKFVLDNFKDVDYILKVDDDCVINVNQCLNEYEKTKLSNIDLVACIRDNYGHMSGPTYLCSKRCADFMANVTLPLNWSNGEILWSGLEKHISDKQKWDKVVPEDYYLSSKIKENGSFKVKNIGGMVDYNYNYRDGNEILSVHNIRTFGQFYAFHIKLNGKGVNYENKY